MIDPIKGLTYVQEHRRTVFLVVEGREDGVSDTVTLLDCTMGSSESKLVVGNPVTVRELEINSTEDKFFQ
jgi:hypothetical protein